MDRGGLPMPVRMALLVLAVAAFGLLVWGVVYAVLGLLLRMAE